MRNALTRVGYFVLIIITLYGVWSFLFRFISNNNLNELLKQTDMAISQQEYDLAYRYLRTIKKNSLSSQDWLRILARFFSIADTTDNFIYLEKESNRAMQFHRNREDFKAFYTLALTENNKLDLASRTAEKYLSDLRFNDIRTRAILSNLYKHQSNPLAEAEKHFKEHTNSTFYSQMAELLNEPLLYFNTAVLYLMEGSEQKAANLYPLFIHNHKISITRRALFAYEIKEFNMAFELLNSQPISYINNIEAILLLADLNLIKKNYLLALELYRTVISMNATFSPIPWLNVALLNEKLFPNSETNTYSILLEGFNYFPLHTHILIALTQRSPDQLAAEEQIRKFNQSFPYDVDSYLFWLNHFSHIRQIDNIKSKLWDLFNHSPNNAKLARYMIWFFLGQRNFNDAYMVIERFKGNDTVWIPSYRALILALEGNLLEARNILEKEEKSWINLYNYAIILAAIGQYEEAIMHLITTAAIYRGSDPDVFNTYQYASIHSKLAEIYLLNNSNALAHTAAHEALRNDPNNNKALQILQVLARTE